MSLSTPILLCTFNRPDLTQRVFTRIAATRPQTLLISSDGPRADRPHDQYQVQLTRRMLQQIDWPCDVRTFFSETNQGCRRQMADAITWGFKQFSELIILEDDCLPAPSFFSFCEKLLERYAHDPRVMMISGDNFQDEPASPFSYYFSKYAHIWGWASWRRAWSHFELDMPSWPQDKASRLLDRWTRSPTEHEYWSGIFDSQHQGLIDTWDFSWQFACWKYDGWSILPNVNLVRNIGFESRATHTRDASHWLASRITGSISSLTHPNIVARETVADEITWGKVFDPQRQRPAPRHRRGKDQQAA